MTALQHRYQIMTITWQKNQVLFTMVKSPKEKKR